MIDIEQHALRAFEQDALALALVPVEQLPNRIDIGRDFRRDGDELLQQLVAVDLGLAHAAPQGIVMDERAVDFGGQRLQIGEIGRMDAPAAPTLSS